MTPFWSVFLAILAIIAGVLSAWPNVIGEDKLKKRLGIATIAVLLLTVGIKTIFEIRTLSTTKSTRQFEDEKLPRVDEASGAAFVNGRLFVVDDEEKSLFELGIDGDRARVKHTFGFVLCRDAVVRPPITADDVTKASELEAIAAYRGTLVVLSSHAPKKSGDDGAKELSNKRALLMQLRVDDASGKPCVARATTLKPLVEGMHDVNIEGLAIRPDGTTFVGFRSPLDGDHARVFSMRLADAFAGNLQRHEYRLPLGKYGITALEPDGDDILVLGNAPEKTDIFKPRLWRWRPSQDDEVEAVRPTRWDYGLPTYANAKAEGIAVNGDDVWVVLDAPRWGGVRHFARAQIQ